MQLPPVVLIRDWLFVSPLNGAVGLNRPSGWECWLCLDWESNGWALLWSWLVLTPELRLLMRALTLQGVSKWLYAWMPHQHRNCKYLWLRANIIRYTVSIEYKYYVFTLLWITALGIVFWKKHCMLLKSGSKILKVFFENIWMKLRTRNSLEYSMRQVIVQ